jgi:short-subunit dehydrogenase
MKKKSKVVMITGATSGFGKATAHHLAANGYLVYGFGRSADDINSENANDPIMMKMDVNDDFSVKEAVNKVVNNEGRIDVLLNVAGVGISGSVEDVSIAEVRGVFETNVFGSLRVSQAVLPHMREAGTGLIVFVSSIGGLIGLPFQGIYSSTKFAVEGLAEALFIEVESFGIDVVIVEPGDFATDFTAKRIKAYGAESDESAYREAYRCALNKIEKDESGGCHPDIFAITMKKIIEARRRKMRYMIGDPMQKSSVMLKRLLPSKVFGKLIGKYYGL